MHPCFFSDFCNITNFTNLSLDPEHLSALNTPEHFLMFVHQSHSSLNIPDILVGGNLPMLIFFTKLLVPIPILFSVELKNEELILFLEENTCTGLARFCGRGCEQIYSLSYDIVGGRYMVT